MGGDRDGICHEIDLFSSTSNRRVGASLGLTLALTLPLALELALAVFVVDVLEVAK
jgi:hypothetical protein